ncbi:hypothetical protein VM1G_11607 [Cytospora mali]|uniref:Uncharacterized protein n=1 Tax=Cytospora mali TaxID=578113 RepID=A0A194VYF6_CYTMA|nr:hypothetical protein VM1G_11607 [Valsa mali]
MLHGSPHMDREDGSDDRQTPWGKRAEKLPEKASMKPQLPAHVPDLHDNGELHVQPLVYRV